ncbi:nuclear exosome regulator NRDE2 [Anabrus simplex]|uniref:nuclear exosome regulator NRDE2 n=1 Tax=Anabrus simplex TaxID=316456 RepID=UPI0035A27C2E
MSIFPAYNERSRRNQNASNSETVEVEVTKSTTWLENASFNVKLPEKSRRASLPQAHYGEVSKDLLPPWLVAPPPPRLSVDKERKSSSWQLPPVPPPPRLSADEEKESLFSWLVPPPPPKLSAKEERKSSSSQGPVSPSRLSADEERKSSWQAPLSTSRLPADDQSNSSPWQESLSTSRLPANDQRNSSSWQESLSTSRLPANEERNSSSWQESLSTSRLPSNEERNSSSWQAPLSTFRLPADDQRNSSPLQESLSTSRLPANYQRTSSSWQVPLSTSRLPSDDQRNSSSWQVPLSTSKLPADDQRNSSPWQVPLSTSRLPAGDQRNSSSWQESLSTSRLPADGQRNSSPWQVPLTTSRLPAEDQRNSSSWQESLSTSRLPSNEERNSSAWQESLSTARLPADDQRNSSSWQESLSTSRLPADDQRNSSSWQVPLSTSRLPAGDQRNSSSCQESLSTSRLPAGDQSNSSSLQVPLSTSRLPSIEERNSSCQESLSTSRLTGDDQRNLPSWQESLSPPTLSADKEGMPSSDKKRSKKQVKRELKRKKTAYGHVAFSIEDDHFYEDKTCQRGNLKVKTLSRPAVPLYHSRFSALSWVSSYLGKKKKKLKKKQRYYLHVEELPEELEDGKENPTSEVPGNKDQPAPSDNRVEEELCRRTAEFNKVLANEPHNEQMWLKYVRFQDIMRQFECTYKRGGGAKSIRVTAERKLSILEKALEHNSGSEALLCEWFLVSESTLPADVMSRQILDMIERQPSCITLWRGFIRTTQCSLSLCSTTAVLKLYGQATGRLHQLRRGAPGSKIRIMEDGILDLLLDCGLFLRQAGLWEQLWMLIKMYLELTLAQSGTQLFKDLPSVSEEYITSLEERILTSQLPLPELWYRVERLRECAHWLPWSSSADCEDPQRLVFPDDVSDLLHPITTPGLNFKLVLIVLTLLKVPLLPCRSTTLQFLGADQVPWYLDCAESLLSVHYPQGTVELVDESLLKGVSSLMCGPQYLLDHWPGQEQYLDFVTKLFVPCSDCLTEPLRVALCVWWLRFERFLLILNKHGHGKVPPTRKKKIKSVVKDFLKKEENRNNCLFYLEYALLESELGQREGACKILQTIIAAQQGGVPVINIVNENQKAGLCSLYRTLCEFFLRTNADVAKNVGEDNKKALSVLVALGSGSPQINFDAELKEGKIASVADKFHHITTELFARIDTNTLARGSEHLLPHFTVDWVVCHAWFLLLTRSPWDAGALFEKALTYFPPAQSVGRAILTAAMCQREAIFESYISMLHHHCRSTSGAYSVLQEVLHRALQEFPDNQHFLATVASIETRLGCASSPWWKLSRYFNKTTSLMAPVFQVFLARHKQAQLDEACVQSHTFLATGGPVITSPSGKNWLSAFFKQFLKLPTTKRSPLLWRLYLQFLSEQGKEELYTSTFYRAVEECPWVKVLYVEATKLLPAKLPELQDLLMEKELRVHVTPEELDILRSDPPKA